MPKGVGPSPSFAYQDDRLSCFGSGHPGGANFVLGDGSVQFVTLTDIADLPVLQRLAKIDDGEIVKLD
jgi:prepilin-type processing-associated H-X9-DG protein